MIGASLASDYDQDKYAIVPAYLTSTRALFGKYACDKYGADIGIISDIYGVGYAKLDSITPPVHADSTAAVQWNRFFAALPDAYKEVGFKPTKGQYAPSILLDRYHAWLQKRFHGDIRVLDLAYTEEDNSFLSVYPPYERPSQRLYSPGTSLKETDWAIFKATLPSDWFYPVLCDPLYQKYLKDELYSGKIENLNAAWGTAYKTWSEIELAESGDGLSGQALRDRQEFIRAKAPLRYLKVPVSLAPQWADYLTKHNLPLSKLPKAGEPLPSGSTLRAYAEFIRTIAFPKVAVVSSDTLWRRNTGDSGAHPPVNLSDWRIVLNRSRDLRCGYLLKNYKFALNFLLLHGRGILNTVIYCGGAVLAAVIINPLCAYALSRFKLPYTQSVLLFLLSTMAFPAEVAMIPNFLMLKDLGLLNTFWALILPGAASGFSIFLLKGFFDSLPQELYEAGMIDGANEISLFGMVTLPLAKPIFAVIALQAFTASYGAFLFAMLVCQAQSHWTLMVWIYEFQALNAPQFVTMAALVIAAIPTLLVFLFTQNIIMRGIILPSMK
jgi:multiple sugar transport system permease protein